MSVPTAPSSGAAPTGRRACGSSGRPPTSFTDVHGASRPARARGRPTSPRALDLAGLPAGQDIFYRVSFQDLGDLKTTSEPATGRFRTPPAGPRATCASSGRGDTAGQGWGINPDWGGMKIYETMRQAQPDFFIHCGDTIYADGPIAGRGASSPDGTVWKNVVTEEKSKVAETLDEFRGNYRYNLMDEQRAPLQRRGAADLAVGRPRGHQQLVGRQGPARPTSATPRRTCRC